jgi:hypothetical protein
MDEWDKPIWYTYRVLGRDVSVCVKEHYTSENPGVPQSVVVSGPNGLKASSLHEMLDLLGIPHEKPPAPALPPPAAPQLVEEIRAAEEGSPSAEVKASAVEPSHNGTAAPENATAAEATLPSRNGRTGKKREEPVWDPERDAKDMQEASRRQERWAEQHPWLWPMPEDIKEFNRFDSDMRIAWLAERFKAAYPERHAAALDPEKYRAYLEKHGEKVRNDLPRITADGAPRCQFVKLDGQTCGSPAMKHRRFCCFHSRTRVERKKKKEIEVPVLEDDRSIQMTVTHVCRGLADGSLEGKRAATLLYGLQVAAVAVRMKKK